MASLTSDEATAKHQPLSDYERGLVDGLHRHAWMKDGVYYVGTGIYTLGQAIDRAITNHREVWAAVQERDPTLYGDYG